jgi:hypothetical protein
MGERNVENPDRRKQGAMERHIQTILLAVATSALIALGTFTYRAAETFARLDQRLISMGEDLSAASQAIEKLADTAETKANHERDMALADSRLMDHEDRLRRIEGARR